MHILTDGWADDERTEHFHLAIFLSFIDFAASGDQASAALGGHFSSKIFGR